MPKYCNVPIRVLADRLGLPHTRRVSGTRGHVFWLMWACNGQENLYDSCRATNRSDRHEISDRLEALASFDHYGFPKEGWDLETCSHHGEMFLDFPRAEDS